MPWINSKRIAPPVDKEILTASADGVVAKRTLTTYQIYDGRGGFDTDMPPFWQRLNGDADAPIPAADLKGLPQQHDQEQHIEIKPIFPEPKCEDTSPASEDADAGAAPTQTGGGCKCLKS